MMIKRVQTYLPHFAGAAALFALAACSSAPARQADIYYDLRPTIAPVSFASNDTLEIQSVTVKGLQSARSLVIETGKSPVQYQEVRGHLWHVAPSNLIERAVTDALSSASQDMVIGSSQTVDNEDYRLKLTVEKLHFTPSETAHLDIEAVLKNKSGKIITTKRYQIAQAIAGSDNQAAVMALEMALADMIGQLAKDIRSAL